MFDPNPPDPQHFDALFRASDDPWRFKTRWYEARKRAVTLACLPAARYAHGFEPGCANGELSAELATRCDHLLACDGSHRAVELAQARLAAWPQAQVVHAQLPDEWPEATLATVTTHDLPTVFGVWQHTDGTPEMAAELQAAVTADMPAGATVELHEQVARSAARLCLATLDDLAGLTKRPNYPGMVDDEHPNWCRRLPATTDTILAGSPGQEIVATLAAARPAPGA